MDDRCFEHSERLSTLEARFDIMEQTLSKLTVLIEDIHCDMIEKRARFKLLKASKSYIIGGVVAIALFLGVSHDNNLLYLMKFL
jgi:hypothetical protein